MKILLLGKTGLLGSEFPEILEKAQIEFVAPSHIELDLLDFAKVDQFLAGNFFDKILYCAAYTDVDKAETERGLCERMNVKALENILTHRRPIIHFSTDYVFNAPPNFSIPEDYERKTLNFYGQSKLQAEKLLETSNVPFWNVRPSWLFGKNKENFVTKILKLSQEQDVLKIVGDQIGRPTSTKDLAEFVVQNFLLKTQEVGHFHLQNSGNPVSWAEFAKYFLKKKNWDGEIREISSDELEAKVIRPKNSVLQNTKLPENLRDWQEAVDEFLGIIL
ncbi:NAD(P)-dependent oxidoreductase [Candidatus Gracilibacteria bacterium]|nr:NAD(P)-dependent oxidoreductase [Candidatus Gracilibacteria bacterium]